jgi:hypothetical protein
VAADDVFDRCAAVLWAGLAGFEGGRAIADVISGAVNPSGKLPFAYPASPSHLLTYDHKPSNEDSALPGSRWTTRPVRQLGRFEKVVLAPGESKAVSFAIDPWRDLSFPDEAGRRRLEPGFFRLSVGGQSARFRLD